MIGRELGPGMSVHGLVEVSASLATDISLLQFFFFFNNDDFH